MSFILERIILKMRGVISEKSYKLNKAWYKKNKNRKNLYKANRLFLKHIFVPK